MNSYLAFSFRHFSKTTLLQLGEYVYCLCRPPTKDIIDIQILSGQSYKTPVQLRCLLLFKFLVFGAKFINIVSNIELTWLVGNQGVTEMICKKWSSQYSPRILPVWFFDRWAPKADYVSYGKQTSKVFRFCNLTWKTALWFWMKFSFSRWFTFFKSFLFFNLVMLLRSSVSNEDNGPFRIIWQFGVC